MTTRTTAGRRWTLTATEAVTTHVFDHVFTLATQDHFRSSGPTLAAVWDGTDPLLGGHPAARNQRRPRLTKAGDCP
jgi:hypothetical protein